MLVENHLSTTRCSTCGNVQRAIRKEAYQEKSWVMTDTMVDPLESLARLGAQQMLQAALEQEVEDYLEQARYVCLCILLDLLQFHLITTQQLLPLLF
jgi:hypothetical protein